MKQINLWVFILLTWMWTGCKEDSLSLPGDGTGKAGKIMIEFVAPNTDVSRDWCRVSQREIPDWKTYWCLPLMQMERVWLSSGRI